MELIFFWHMYHNHANAVKSFERGDTNKETIWSLIKQKDAYSKVYVPTFDVFPIYYLFFTQNVDEKIIGKMQKNLLISQIDTIYFINHDCTASQLTSEMIDKDMLVLDRADCPEDPRFMTLDTFTRHDGTKSYRFIVPKEDSNKN